MMPPKNTIEYVNTTVGKEKFVQSRPNRSTNMINIAKTVLSTKVILVWLQDFRGSNKWISGVIVESVDPVSYKIQLQDGQVCK